MFQRDHNALTFCFNPKMKALQSFETSVTTCRMTQRHNPNTKDFIYKHVHYFTIPTSVQVFNTLKRVKYLKHSYMFRHYNVILREYVVALLKLLYTLMFMQFYVHVILARQRRTP